MSNALRKIKRNKGISFSMAMKFQCPHCGYQRLISRQTIQQMTDDEFQHSKIFMYNKCNVRMYPITIEVDF